MNNQSNNPLLLNMATLAQDRNLLIAFSGGLDSTVLLYQLAQLRVSAGLTIRAMHIHHGLSPKADEWLAHCSAFCQQLAIPFIAERVCLTGEGGLESAARAARYQALARQLQPEEILVTAHHQDDQCETLLLALKRGSGPAGLASMPTRLAFAGTWLVRPLLATSRAALCAYAEQVGLTYCEDESNQDQRFDRNFLRQTVLPLFQQRWPHFTRSVARSALLCGEQEMLIDELLQDELQQIITDQQALEITPLREMSSVRRQALLRRWLAHCSAPIVAREMLQRIWQEVALARVDACPEIALGNGVVRRFQNRLYWGRPYSGQRSTQINWPDLAHPLTLPDNLGELTVRPWQPWDVQPGIRSPYPAEQVRICFYAAGKLAIDGRAGRRSLKKIWQECQVAPWLRDNIPIIFYDDKPICAPGYFITESAYPLQEEGLTICWKTEVLDAR